MFGIYFGNYLQNKGVISLEQHQEILKEIKSARLKMGLLAVVNEMMTEAQAEQVNQLQQMQDRRFGDIAIEKGYLTQEQVETLLKQQGDQYLLYVQALTEHGYLTLETIQSELNAYKKEERLSALDLDCIKSSDLDKIVQVFLKEPSVPPIVKDYIALMARNMIRFIDTDLRLEQAEKINSVSLPFVASQELEGDFHFFVGLSGDTDATLTVASAFAKEEFEIVDEDALDSICEFINCNNGLFASKLSEEDIIVELMPPAMYTSSTKIQTEGAMYKMPMYVSGKKLELIICLEAKWKITSNI